MPNKIVTPFWGTSKNLWLDPKVCADPSWLLVFKNGLKKSSSLENQPFWWPKWPQNARNSWWNVVGPPKPFFCIKDKKPIYTKCRPYMGLHSCQLPVPLKKF